MTAKLLDLQGRQDEPDVLRLLEYAHARPERIVEARAHYGSGEWAFVGFVGEAGEVVACAGAERYDDRSIGIRSIAVAPHWRRRGLGRAMVVALLQRSGLERVVAETDDDAVEFYRQCGFDVQDAPPKFGRARYWCVLEARDARLAQELAQRPARPHG